VKLPGPTTEKLREIKASRAAEKKSLRRFGAAACIALVAVCLYFEPARAQEGASDTEARYQEAERYRTGDGVAVDLDRARSLHEALVAEGHAPSLVRLADTLEQQGLFAEAIDTYGKAVQAGSDYARLRLAAGHLQGRFGPLSDPATGFPLLRAIAENEDNDLAALYLADAYAAGQGTSPDIAAALALYEDLSKRGNAMADLRLGELYAEGTQVPQDLPRAIDHFGRAIAGGNDTARVGLAKALVAAGRGAEALPVIDEAVARGVRMAETLRAVWHFEGGFGDASDRAFGAAEMRRLAEAGDVYVARRALIAHERKSRRIEGLDLEKVLAGLNVAAEAGNQQAMISLARAYRELAWLIPDARERHRALVERYGAELGVDYEVPERLESLYDPDHPAESREAAFAFLAKQGGEAFENGLMRLRTIDQSAYVYALERLLQDRGYATGPADGTLDTASLAAVQAFCRDEGLWDVCQHGPLNYDSAKVIVPVLGRLHTGG